MSCTVPRLSSRGPRLLAAALLAALAGSAGCAEETDPIAVSMDVVVGVATTDDETTYVNVRVTESTDACVCPLASPWPERGTCTSYSDGFEPCDCVGAWASCMERVSLVTDGAVIASSGGEELQRALRQGMVYIAGEGAIDLLRVEGCGASVEIPLPQEHLAAPLVDDVTVNVDESGQVSSVEVAWSGSPATVTLVSAGDGFVGRQCHVPAGATQTEIAVSASSPEEVGASVTLLDEVTSVEHALGTARVWRRAGASEDALP